MNASQILLTLERERKLLQEFRSLCEQQLVVLDVADLVSINRLLDERADLMLELTAIDATLGTWINQVQADPAVTPEMMNELQFVNDDIVCLAKMVVELDEQTHWRLDLIKSQSADELRTLNRGTNALGGYSRSVDVATGSNMEYLS